MSPRQLMGKQIKGYSNEELKRLLCYFRQPLDNAETRDDLQNKALTLEIEHNIQPRERMEALKVIGDSRGEDPQCPEDHVRIRRDIDLEEAATPLPTGPTPAKVTPARSVPGEGIGRKSTPAKAAAVTRPSAVSSQTTKPVTGNALPKAPEKRARGSRASSVALPGDTSPESTTYGSQNETPRGNGDSSNSKVAKRKEGTGSKSKVATDKKLSRVDSKVAPSAAPNAVTSASSPQAAASRVTVPELTRGVDAHKATAKVAPEQPSTRRPIAKGARPNTDNQGSSSKHTHIIFMQPRTAMESLLYEGHEGDRELAMKHNLAGPSPRLDLDPAFIQLKRPSPQTKGDELEVITSLNEYEAELFDRHGNATVVLKDVFVEYRQYDHIGGWFFFPADKSNENETASLLYCYGRGPAWGAWAPRQGADHFTHLGKHVEAQSDSIDCLIMAGHFVDAGRTIADKGPYSREDWMRGLTFIQTEYLKCVNTDWNNFTRLGSVRKKKRFYDVVLGGLSVITKQKLTVNDFLKVDKIWTSFLKDAFFQFNFTFSVDAWCTGCRKRRQKPPEVGSVIELLNYTSHTASQTFSMRSLLEEYFSSRSPPSLEEVAPWICCGKAMPGRKRMVHGSLPPRLVVSAAARVREVPAPISNHTAPDITFNYTQWDGGEHLATYRWIGGIYLSGQRYRVYWDDQSKENNYTSRLKVYDSMMPDYTCYGYILGGAISPPSAGPERVPEPWCKSPHLLFYERVDSDMRIDQLRIVEGLIPRLISAPERDTGEPRETGPELDDEEVYQSKIRLRKAKEVCRIGVIDELESLKVLGEATISPARAYRERVSEIHHRNAMPVDKADRVLATANPAAPMPQKRFPPLYKPSIWDKGPDGYYLGIKHSKGLVPVMPDKKRKRGDFDIREFLPKKHSRRTANVAGP